MNELALFSGAGGGILGGCLLGWRTVCAVEYNAYARSVLLARQNDGALPPFPIWDDARTFDGRPWRGVVDVVSGGFPCQDISAAGKGDGLDGERSGLWTEMARIIGEVRPRFVFVENSPVLTSRGLGRVLGDLAALGFDAEWGVLGADDCGAPHKRERIWIVAHAHGGQRDRADEAVRTGRHAIERSSESVAYTDRNARHQWRADHPKQGKGGWDADRGSVCSDVADADGWQQEGWRQAGRMGRVWCEGKDAQDRDPRGAHWPVEPDVGRVAHGVALRVDRLIAIGNGQVPRVAATAFRLLAAEFG